MSESDKEGQLDFNDDEVERYSRHILLSEVGPRGQARLRASKVLVVGAGGLGSPALLYLASAGVGQITIIDDDKVDLSNLQRQVVHANKDIGVAKADSAKATLESINPQIKVDAINARLNASNIADVIKGHDVVLDGSDNFSTRYLINDACYLARIPLISGAVLRFEGTLSTFTYNENTACYRCVFPEAPPPGAVPTCQEAGVLGAVVGVVGALQAVEAVKLITRSGDLLENQMLRYDALKAGFSSFNISHDKDCALCGESPTIKEIREEGGACTL